jgi:fatty acid desaturase
MRKRRKPTRRPKRAWFDWVALIAAVGLITGVASVTVAWKPVPPAMMALVLGLACLARLNRSARIAPLLPSHLRV